MRASPLWSLALAALSVFLARAQSPGYPHGGGPCITDEDCSLGGVCGASNECICDPWFTGASCSLLNFAPAKSISAFAFPPSAGPVHSWGGHSVYNPVDKLFHGFFSVMCDNANLTLWESKSSIWHASASVGDGPYTLREMVAPPESHNAYVSPAADGTFALFSIGNASIPKKEWAPCVPGLPAATRVVPAASTLQVGVTSGLGYSIYLRTAPSPAGPWTPHRNNTPLTIDLSGSWATSVSGGNPAPLLLPDGTWLLYFSAGPCPPNWNASMPGCNNCIGVARSDAGVAGPYRVANALPVTSPESEDPAVFVDPRGNFHLLTNVNNDHSRCAAGVPCGGHAWSRDGIQFSRLVIGAFGPVFTFSNGSVYTAAFVERPQVTMVGGKPAFWFGGVGRKTYDDSGTVALEFCTAGRKDCGPTLPPLESRG